MVEFRGREKIHDMLVRLARLAFSVLLAITPVAALTVMASPSEGPTPSLETLTPARHAAGLAPGQFGAALLLTADRPLRPFEIQQPSGLVWRPVWQPLA